ncbi:hypothetical protein GCM10011609_76400 [Lentzea pudingi]|uniref:Uncharacterized protein n=1 Tax=Lentzea pudingi TaxID=1789439 RepID=A0ABQ2IQ35_9PSEU|nr:hypothetical protein GCM10011609_76400 [Lentzea pudingi]
MLLGDYVTFSRTPATNAPFYAARVETVTPSSFRAVVTRGEDRSIGCVLLEGSVDTDLEPRPEHIRYAIRVFTEKCDRSGATSEGVMTFYAGEPHIERETCASGTNER